MDEQSPAPAPQDPAAAPAPEQVSEQTADPASQPSSEQTSATDSSTSATPTVPAATPAAPAAESSAPPAGGGSKKKILLVEDDEGLASVYVARLEAEGFGVRHVPNGEEALSNAIDYKPDMILLDVMMPKISGFDVLDILRNTPETTNIKIIMLTALSQQKDKERAQQLGVDDYLVKSQVVIADVVDRIKYHLGVSPV